MTLDELKFDASRIQMAELMAMDSVYMTKGEMKMYNDRDQCVVETARENTLTAPTMKVVINSCYKKSGEMIEDCLIAASNMFGDDFPKLPNKEPEPQSLLQTAMATDNRLLELDHVLTEIFSRILG